MVRQEVPSSRGSNASKKELSGFLLTGILSVGQVCCAGRGQRRAYHCTVLEKLTPRIHNSFLHAYKRRQDRLRAKPRAARVYLHVSFRRPPAARRLQRFVRRLVEGDARFEVRRVLLARAPARLKNSMISAADFSANSSACASRMFLTICTARISAVCFTGYNLSRRIDRQGLITTFYIDRVKQPNPVEPDDVAEVPADQNVNICNRCECNMKHVVLKPRPKDLLLQILFSRPIDSVETASSSAPPSINSACTAWTCSGACSTSAAVTDDRIAK